MRWVNYLYYLIYIFNIDINIVTSTISVSGLHLGQFYFIFPHHNSAFLSVFFREHVPQVFAVVHYILISVCTRILLCYTGHTLVTSWWPPTFHIKNKFIPGFFLAWTICFRNLYRRRTSTWIVIFVVLTEASLEMAVVWVVASCSKFLFNALMNVWFP